mgnify:FL=1
MSTRVDCRVASRQTASFGAVWTWPGLWEAWWARVTLGRMPVRQATRRYADLASFLREYPSTLGVGALVLSAESLDGEPAPELRVDLVLPMVGRVGPLVGQEIGRAHV